MRHCEPPGPRDARPDDRLRETIQVCARGQMDCFVARAPRNDGETALLHGPYVESGSRDAGKKWVMTRQDQDRLQRAPLVAPDTDGNEN